MAGEVTFQLTEADYVAANRDWYRRLLFSWRAMRAPAFTAIILFVLGAGTGRYLDELPLQGQLIEGGLFAGLGLLLFVLLYGLPYIVGPRQARRTFGQHTTLRKPLYIAWSDAEIRQRTANGEGVYAWTDLHRWRDGTSAVLIYHTDSMYVVIPHRVLTVTQRADLLDTLARSGLPRY